MGQKNSEFKTQLRSVMEQTGINISAPYLTKLRKTKVAQNFYSIARLKCWGPILVLVISSFSEVFKREQLLSLTTWLGRVHQLEVSKCFRV